MGVEDLFYRVASSYFQLFGSKADPSNLDSPRIPSFRPINPSIFQSPDKLSGSFGLITATRVHLGDNLTPRFTYERTLALCLKSQRADLDDSVHRVQNVIIKAFGRVPPPFPHHLVTVRSRSPGSAKISHVEPISVKSFKRRDFLPGLC